MFRLGNVNFFLTGDNMSRSPVKEWIHSYTDINCFFLIIIPIVSGSSNLESIQVYRYISSQFCFYQNILIVEEKEIFISAALHEQLGN